MPKQTELAVAAPSGEPEANTICEAAGPTREPWSWRELRRQPALILSLAYLATSAVGLWASYWYYHPFGLNILQFMQVTDFLAAGLRDPAYLGLVLGGAAGSWLINLPDRWDGADRLRRHWWGRLLIPRWHFAVMRRFGMRTASAWLAISIVLVAAMSIYIYVNREADAILAGGGRRVDLAADADTLKGLCGDPRLIGTTSLYVFLYCGERRRIEIVPVESVGRLSFATVQAAAAVTPAP